MNMKHATKAQLIEFALSAFPQKMIIKDERQELFILSFLCRANLPTIENNVKRCNVQHTPKAFQSIHVCKINCPT